MTPHIDHRNITKYKAGHLTHNELKTLRDELNEKIQHAGMPSPYYDYIRSRDVVNDVLTNGIEPPSHCITNSKNQDQ